MTRRKALMAFLASAVIRPACAQQARQGPYDSGGGPMLTVNGHNLPRDTVFRFMPVTLPLTSIRVTSLYGLRTDPVYGYSGLHPGVDLAAPQGTPAFATAAGVVVRAWLAGDYGNLVEIRHGLGFSTRYGHLSGFAVKAGQVVDRGSLVAVTGATGHVTGPHLHYEIRYRDEPIDPIKFVLKMYELYHHLD
jgi:murein DD-endopeptidase MepM/ murein hydrolase activator NlpD